MYGKPYMPDIVYLSVQEGHFPARTTMSLITTTYKLKNNSYYHVVGKAGDT
jgi:hypothetical protein